MNILRQSLAFSLVFLMAFPAFGGSNAIGQVVDSQAATVRNLSFEPGATLFNDDTVLVGDGGIARIALTGGSQVEVLKQSAARFVRSQSAVQLYLESGTASFRTQPGSDLEAVIADATIRSANRDSAFGTISMQTPDTALVVARKGALEITTLHDSSDVVVPEGSAARITIVPEPDPQTGGPVAVPAGKGLGPFNGRKLAIIALLIGGGLITLGLILGAKEKPVPHDHLVNQVSPYTLN